MDDVPVFETSRRITADRALTILDAMRIPARCTAAAGGLEWQAQVAPVDAPGIRWLIRVPVQHKEAAERELAPLFAEEAEREAGEFKARRSPRGAVFAAVSLLAMMVAAILMNSCPR